MTDKGRPCIECERFESCTNPAKETRGRSYIGCVNNATVAVGEVSDILTEMVEEINEKLKSTGYVLWDMALQYDDRENLIVRFTPDPFADEEDETEKKIERGEVLIDEQYGFSEFDPDAVRKMIEEG